MPSNKESNNTSARNGAQQESRNMPPEEFDVSRLTLDPIVEKKGKDQKADKQFMTFPKYSYPLPKGSKGQEQRQKCIIITGNIHMAKGGIPTVDGDFRKSDDDCMYIHVPLLESCEDGMTLATKFLEPLDSLFSTKIEDDNGRGFISFAKEKERVLDHLSYTPCISECDPESLAGRPSDPQKVYRRVKLRLSTVWKENRGEDEPQQITTKVFTCDDNGDPKPEPENVNTLADLRALLVWKCTVKFAIEVTKFWAAKTVESKGKHKFRKCGVTLKCLQMCITQAPTSINVPTALSSAVFGSKKASDTIKHESDADADSKSDDDDSDGSDTKTNNKNTKKTSNTNSEKQTSKKDDSDSEDTSTKNKKNTKSDSDDDDVSDSKSAPSKKASNKSDSDNSDSEESEKKTKSKDKDKSKKANKKGSSDDDDNDSASDSDTKHKKNTKKSNTKTR